MTQTQQSAGFYAGAGSTAVADIPEVDEQTRLKARDLGWAEGLIERALGSGHSMQEIWQALSTNIDGATAAQFLESEGGSFFKPDYSWMKVPTEWGIRARPADPAMGLTIQDLNVGTYGDIPDVWTIRSEIARGSYPAPVMEDMGYTIFEKAPIWADWLARTHTVLHWRMPQGFRSPRVASGAPT